MTREVLLATLATLKLLDPASAHMLAEALLLEFVCAHGYVDVVEAYLALVPVVGLDGGVRPVP